MNLQVVPMPLERLAVPRQVDGSKGSNRAPSGRAQIAAANDVDAIKAWLARFLDKQTTFDTYRKEAERLLLWSTIQIGKPLSSLTHEDWLVYRAFLADPQPRGRWISRDGRKFARAHAEWRNLHSASFGGMRIRSRPRGVEALRRSAVSLEPTSGWRHS